MIHNSYDAIVALNGNLGCRTYSRCLQRNPRNTVCEGSFTKDLLNFTEMLNLFKNKSKNNDSLPVQPFVVFFSEAPDGSLILLGLFYEEEPMKIIKKNSQYLINSSNSFASHFFLVLLFSITVFPFYCCWKVYCKAVYSAETLILE